MNTLLLFFALPIAVIIISVALQKIFNNPLLVALIVFAVFLVATFVNGNSAYLIATIAYTIIAYITAILTNVISRIIKELNRRENQNNSGCCGRTTTSSINNEVQLLDTGTATNQPNQANTSNLVNDTNQNNIERNIYDNYQNNYYNNCSRRGLYRCFRGR